MREQTSAQVLDRPAPTGLNSASNRHEEAPVVVIQPPGRFAFLDLRELWEYRELLYFLTLRDMKVRYKQTVLGAAWAIIQPVATMVVFTLFFGGLAAIPSDGVPYPLFSFAALVPWTFFANGLTQAAHSVVVSQNLVSKIYFPRLSIPTATVLGGAVDFALAFLILMGMMFFYGVMPSVRLLWLMPLFLLALVSALGVGFWLAALNVRYRDVRYAVPFLVQIWLFTTPIAYPSSLLSEPWRTLYGLNPMAGVVEGFRWALLDSGPAPGSMLLLSSAAALLMLFIGTMYFRRTESTFADVI